MAKELHKEEANERYWQDAETGKKRYETIRRPPDADPAEEWQQSLQRSDASIDEAEDDD